MKKMIYIGKLFHQAIFLILVKTNIMSIKYQMMVYMILAARNEIIWHKKSIVERVDIISLSNFYPLTLFK